MSIKERSNSCIDSQLTTLVKFVGVTLDKSLNCSIHIYYRLTVPKICRPVFLLRKLVNCVPLEFERKSYLAFIQSHVRYGLLIWDGFSKIEFVLLVQKTMLVQRLMKLSMLTGDHFLFSSKF